MIRNLINKAYHPDRGLKRIVYRHWNRVKFRLLGVALGNNSNMWSKIYLHVGENAKVSIGANFAFQSGDNFNPLCHNTYGSIFVLDNATLTIGNDSGMSGGTIWATDSITIGDNVKIGANCTIIDGDIHSTDWRRRRDKRPNPQRMEYKHKPIFINDDVWLGANTIVLKGVTIGKRTIIGAGSVVTKDIPADCIAAGNPCKVLRQFVVAPPRNNITVGLEPQSKNTKTSGMKRS